MMVNAAAAPPFKWSACTEALARSLLNIDPGSASPSEISRISLYEQTWGFARRERIRQRKDNDCFVLGISAPQGSGKTTLTKALEFMAGWTWSKSSKPGDGGCNGYHCASLSLDDFYLKGTDQDKLSDEAVNNPLLCGRGNPGTHDMRLGLDTIRRLRHAENVGEKIHLPRYDKSLRGGRGDRVEYDQWPVISGPVDFVFLEGWMLGFQPLDDQSPALLRYSRLREVNRHLKEGGYLELNVEVDAWVVFAVEALEDVFHWRLEAEREMIHTGRDGMDDEVKCFVQRYMPAYHTYLPGLLNPETGPRGCKDRPISVLFIQLDHMRNPLSICEPTLDHCCCCEDKKRVCANSIPE